MRELRYSMFRAGLINFIGGKGVVKESPWSNFSSFSLSTCLQQVVWSNIYILKGLVAYACARSALHVPRLSRLDARRHEQGPLP